MHIFPMWLHMVRRYQSMTYASNTTSLVHDNLIKETPLCLKGLITAHTQPTQCTCLVHSLWFKLTVSSQPNQAAPYASVTVRRRTGSWEQRPFENESSKIFPELPRFQSWRWSALTCSSCGRNRRKDAQAARHGHHLTCWSWPFSLNTRIKRLQYLI